MLIHVRYSLSLSSKGSLACHTYCGTFFDNGRLLGPMIIASVAKRLHVAVELSLPVLTT